MYKVTPEGPNLIRRLVELSFDQGKNKFKEFKVEFFYKNGVGYTESLPIQGCTTASCKSVSDETLAVDNINDYYFDFTLLNWTDEEKSQVEKDLKQHGLDYFIQNNWIIDYDEFFVDVPFIVDMIDGEGNVALAPPPDYPDPELDIKRWQAFAEKNLDKLD